MILLNSNYALEFYRKYVYFRHLLVIPVKLPWLTPCISTVEVVGDEAEQQLADHWGTAWGFTAEHSLEHAWKRGHCCARLVAHYYQIIEKYVVCITLSVLQCIKGHWAGVPRGPNIKVFFALCMLGNKSYLLVFTASKNIVPSQSYGLSKLGLRL